MAFFAKKAPKKSLASRSRHYVTFQEENDVSDGEGGFDKGWTNITDAEDIPVEILPIQAIRKEEMRSLNVRATHYIRVRYHIPIEEVGRVVWTTDLGTRYFTIHTIENVQERDYEQFCIAEEIRP